MVDTSDLKSGDYIGREGSSPSGPNNYKINIKYYVKIHYLFLIPFQPKFFLYEQFQVFYKA